jgi:pimeloyl-ACP methyl ester carboxylesterase
MNTCIAISSDGARIAYDVNGTGAPVILLHGGFQTRRNWHITRYVERIKNEFKAIAMDLRGNGESDKPAQPADYGIDRHCQDILSVADACGIDRFAIWGYSLGGNIGRYLAAQSSRVSSLIMMGVTFCLGASGEFRQLTIRFRDHWLPILEAQRNGTLDAQSLSQEDQEQLQAGHIPLTVAFASGMLEWGSLEPCDVRCPTLWLAGSRNDFAMAGIGEYRTQLKGSNVQVQVIEGLDHSQELTSIDKVLPVMLAFTRTPHASAPHSP